MDAAGPIAGDALLPQPVHVPQADMASQQRLLRTNHDLPAFGIEAHHIARFLRRQAKAASLPYREIDDPLVPADNLAF
jgi:hypothetical protein